MLKISEVKSKLLWHFVPIYARLDRERLCRISRQVRGKYGNLLHNLYIPIQPQQLMDYGVSISHIIKNHADLGKYIISALPDR